MPKFCIGKGRRVINYNLRAHCCGYQNHQISKKIGVGQSVLCLESHKKLSYVCLGRPLYAFFTSHAYRPQMPCAGAISTAHARSQVGKGRRLTQGTRLSSILLQANVAMMRGYAFYRALVTICTHTCNSLWVCMYS